MYIILIFFISTSKLKYDEEPIPKQHRECAAYS